MMLSAMRRWTGGLWGAVALVGLLQVPAWAEEYPRFNTRVGSQTFLPAYQFEGGTKDKLVETTDRLLELGSGVAKFEMSERVNTAYGVSLSGVGNLVALAQTPSYDHVLGQPFDTFMVWAYPFGINALNNHWGNGYSAAEAEADYTQLRALTEQLRSDPRLAGKQVLIGFWEGDNALRNGSGDPNFNPGTTRINGMKDWLRNRQQAIEDGRDATPTSTVGVYHYAEVNLVLQTQWDPRYVTMLRNVFDDPTVVVDLISYSCWDVSTVGDDNALDGFLTWSLNEIQTRGNFTGAYPHPVPVFIGEHGRPRRNGACTDLFTAGAQRNGARLIIQSAVRFNCPFVLYWQIYNNETAPGCQLGYWLIDNTNTKQLVWSEHNEYLWKANVLRNQTRLWLDRNPTDSEFIAFTNSYKTLNTSTMLDALLNGSAFSAEVSDDEFVSFLMETFHGDANDQAGAGYLAQLGSSTRAQVLNAVMNGATFKDRVSDADFALSLYEGTLMRAPGSVGSGELAATVGALATTPRSTVWRLSILNSGEFAQGELSLRDVNERQSPVILRRHLFDFSAPAEPVAETLQIF